MWKKARGSNTFTSHCTPCLDWQYDFGPTWKLIVNINVTGQSLHEVEGRKSPTELTTILPVDWSWDVTQKVPLTLWSFSLATAQTTSTNKQTKKHQQPLSITISFCLTPSLCERGGITSWSTSLLWRTAGDPRKYWPQKLQHEFRIKEKSHWPEEHARVSRYRPIHRATLPLLPPLAPDLVTPSALNDRSPISHQPIPEYTEMTKGKQTQKSKSISQFLNSTII